MSLFQKSVEKKYLNELDSTLIDKKFAEFQDYFANPERQENIRNSKEEQFQEGFLRELFVKIFGYTLNPEPDFNLTTELKNITNSKKADGAILKGEDALAVIELKGTDTSDLDKIETQAFGYKNHHPKCIYVITSNFEKLRFYIQNAVDHIDFDLFKLSREQFSLMWLCLAKDNLINDLPIKIKESSVLQEENITKELYADYSKFREAIYNNLVKNNPDTDKLLLFKKTQKLLDRFLFIFFAEDRLLLPPNSISEIVKQWTTLKDELDEYIPLYSRFKKYFGYMNTGYKGKKYEIYAYNGGLFAHDEILDTISIDDDILHEHTLKLSKYDFETDVDVNILGHIFEHSLGEIENVQAEIKGEKVDNQKTKRKKDGIFYTPKYITKYIVENTVGKLFEEKRTALGIVDEEYAKGRKNRKKDTIKALDSKLTDYRDWLLTLTILDPACGSGAFLNEALNFLITEHRKIDDLRAQLFDGAIIFSDITTDILEKNIYGVDLNEESVEIAKLSLWLRTAQKGRKLNTLSSNIKCGNSLIDDPEVAGEKAFNWKSEFPQIFREKVKKAWHITTATHNSRYSQRMFDSYIKLGKPVWLSEKEETIVTETIASVAITDKLNILAYNICGDHMHLVLVCEEEDVPKIVGKLKAMSARACNIEMGRTVPSATRGHAPLSIEDTSEISKNVTPVAKKENDAREKNNTERGKTQTQLWTQKFGCKEITSDQQFVNTVEYIRTNREKHQLPDISKGLQALVQKMVCTQEHAFRTEYKGGFDVVIGNPPYGAKLEKEDKEFLKNKYKITEYNYDTYNFFFELSLDILKKDSYLGFITPNTFLVVENGILLRKFLFEENRLIELYETFNVFPDAVVEPMTSIIQKTPSSKEDTFNVLLDVRDKSKLERLYFKHDHIFYKESLIFNYRETEEQRNLYLKLQKITKPLSEFASVKAGIKPYEKGKGNPPQSREVVNDKPFNSFEKIDDSWCKLVRGTQINRYKIIWDGEYLKYGKWLAAPRNPESFFQPKIIIRRTDDKILASYDEEKYVGLNSIHCLQLKDDSIDYRFFLSLINSKLCNWYFQHENFHMVGKPLAEVKVVFVERLPILVTKNQNDFSDKAQIIIDLNAQLLKLQNSFAKYLSSQFQNFELTKKLLNWNELEFINFIKELNNIIKKSDGEKLSKSDEMEWMELFEAKKSEAQSLKSEIEKTDKEIDQMVYELYALSDEEIAIVESENN